MLNPSSALFVLVFKCCFFVFLIFDLTSKIKQFLIYD
jgi:hypothetical protein